MKYSEEWGSGKIISRDNTPLRLGRRAHSGGSGIVFSGGGLFNGFCLKLVSLLDDKRNIKNLFWQEAKSVSLYTSVARNIPGCVTCPIPAHYWIHENDALCKNISFPPNVNRLSNFISLFRIQPEQLDKYGIDPEKYCYIPADLLNTVYRDCELAKHAEKYLPSDLHKKIFDSRIKADILLTYPLLKCNGSIEDIFNEE